MFNINIQSAISYPTFNHNWKLLAERPNIYRTRSLRLLFQQPMETDPHPHPQDSFTIKIDFIREIILILT